MTPVYASNRIDMSGWYTFQEPKGRLALWDGGINLELGLGCGIWCPKTSDEIPMPLDYLKRLPPVVMYGWLDGEDFVVMDFPHPNLALEVFTESKLVVLTASDHSPLMFTQAVSESENVFSMVPDCPATFVKCRVLPEDGLSSLSEARSLGPRTLVRHPASRWTRRRNPLYASVDAPPVVRAIIRDIEIEEGFVNRVDCWLNPRTQISFPPMYYGDHQPDNKVFVAREKIDLFIYKDTVIGYE